MPLMPMRDIDKGQSTVPATNVTGIEIFEAMEDLLKSLEKLNGLVGSRNDWYQSFCPSHSISLSNDPSQAFEDKQSLRKALEAKHVLQSFQRALPDLSQWAATQRLDCENQVAFLKLRSGFLSLPDEILSLVLDFAVYDVDECRFGGCDTIARTINAATKLSLVCSRFRRLITSSPCLWDRIYPEMPLDLVSSCFSRCGPSAEVHLFNPSHCAPGDNLQDYISLASDNAKCWRRLVLDCARKDHSSFFPASFGIAVNWMKQLPTPWANATPNLDAPFLFELNVLYPDEALSLTPNGIRYNNPKHTQAIHFYRTWSTPKLHRMTTQNLIPVPFTSSSNLRSLSIELSFGSNDRIRGSLDVRALAFFLTSCLSLEEFTLGLAECKSLMVASPDGLVSITRVSTFNLRLENCKGAIVKSLLRTILFPNISFMKVVIGANPGAHKVAEATYVQSIIGAVFPDAGQFPDLKHLRLILDIRGHLGGDQPISLPFTSLSTLEHLELTTHEVNIAPISNDVLLPLLQSLTLTACPSLRRDWIVDLLRRLRDQTFRKESVHLVIDGVAKPDFLYPVYTFGSLIDEHNFLRVEALMCTNRRSLITQIIESEACQSGGSG